MITAVDRYYDFEKEPLPALVILPTHWHSPGGQSLMDKVLSRDINCKISIDSRQYKLLYHLSGTSDFQSLFFKLYLLKGIIIVIIYSYQQQEVNRHVSL